MYDKYNVYLDGATVPTLIEPITADIWVYNELADKAKQKLTMAPMQLTIAYCQLVDHQPANLEIVKTWAREHRVQIEVADEVGPTQSAAPAD